MSSDNGRSFEVTTEIRTTDEEGNEHIFELVEEFEVEEKDYALLIYKGTPEEAEEKASSEKAKEEDDEEGYDENFVIMRVTREEGEEADVYEYIDDEDEFEKVVTYLEEQGEFEFDILEGDEDEEGEQPGSGGHVHGPGCNH